nr:AT-rich interactive domain-containing protein 4B-like isoform X1 [Lytechinus pictus]
MAGEGPPFLTVGTDVSAKYRGAFCEAKVKVVKKLVKCKINFKSGTSCIVSDDFVKGTLKIGAKVEAKMTESSPYEDGTIMKLNDASLYTVVFDDGDEKTLRRTLLCLQGEKHFHESETLDHLPLTDPENFGTPVMKDTSKMRRKRRMSNRSQHEEEEEDDDDEEEDSDSDSPKKQRKEEPEDAVGKIVIVEMNEKRKNSFFPALVVDPSCTKDVQTKGKDYIVARSFKDNKFYTVARSSRKPFLSKDHTYKGDVASLKAATEKAVTFIDTGQLPSNWDMEMLKKKRSGKQGQGPSDAETSEDSSDDEYDMEKDAWLASLHKFMEERGTPINKPPVLGFRDLNLYKLYKLVQDQGGCRKVTDRQMWRHIMTKMGIPVPASQQPYNIHTSYNKYLFAFEEFNRKMGPGPRVFTRTRRRSFDRGGWITSPPIISRQRSLVKQGIKDEPSDREEETESPSQKRVTRKKGEDAGKSQEQEESKRETREAKTRSKEIDKEEKDSSDRDEKKSGKKSVKDDKVKDRGSKDGKDKVKDKPVKEDSVKEKVKDRSAKADSDKIKDRSKDTPSKDSDEKISEKASEGKGKPKDAKGKEEKGEKSKEDKKKEEKAEEKQTEAKGKEKEKQVSKGKEKKGKGSGRDDETTSPTPPPHITGAGYDVGERVLVHYGRGRTEKIYEAKVVDIELKGKDHVFTVHYTGWNNRYDEAVRKARIVGSAEKKKKKLIPKGKPEKEKLKKDAEKKEKEEQQRKEREEMDRREREEKERRARQEQEQKEREEAERLEKARAEKERQEKERQEKLEKERKEKLEKERLERERKERQEREKKERLERERQEKELKERLEKERQERDRKERQEKERKEKQERDRREKAEREKKEKERLEQEKQEKELAEKAKEEKERKEKAGKEGKKTPSGKRGRPSLNKSSPAPQTPPRTTPSARGKSPSPASVFSQRSMRSDRKSLTESPFASGLNVRSRSKRSSTGEYRRGAQDDSDSELDELDAQSESQQSTQDSEDSQLKDTSAQEPEDHDDNESTKTEDYAATLTKVSEEKPSFDDDLDEGPPTLTAEVAPESVESRLQEVESEAPKVEEVDKVIVEKEGRSKTKKESKIRLRKSIDKERDGKDSANESSKGDKVTGKDGVKGNNDAEDVKEKISDTPVLERQISMEDELKEKLEDLKQESKGSASDADKPTEKKKGRRKGRKSLESRKRSKPQADVVDISEKSEASEPSEPKKKHAKIDRRKSDKGGRKSKVQETKTPADNTDSDFGTSSIEDKSIPGTSKSFMTTPPTTPESSPKMPSSPACEEDLQMKTEEQSSNKSDSDALIEVASIDDREMTETRENSSTPLASSAPKKATSSSQQASPKKRRRGLSESEHTKKRRKHGRRRQSSISERRNSAKERGNNNSSDTDESRSESRLTSSSAKRHMSLKKYARSLPPSRVSDSGGQEGNQKQRRWNFLVDLSTVKEPDERIAIIQHQLSELRSVYLQLKQEVATIDRRRKKFRKKEREAAQVMAGVALGHCLSQGQDRMESGGGS